MGFQFIAGPFAGQLPGYRPVIVIRRNTDDLLCVWRELDVDGTSPWFRSLARNKKSVMINMICARRKAARAPVRQLADHLDVVIENFKPGTLEKWGLGPDVLRVTNPGLIFTCSARPSYASLFRFIINFPDKRTSELSAPLLTTAFGTALALLARRAKQDKGVTEGLTVDPPESDRKGVLRSPSGSSVTGIVPTGARPCAPNYVTIGANAVSMYWRAEIEGAIVAWTSTSTVQYCTRDKVPRRVVSVRDIERGADEDVWFPLRGGWTVKMPLERWAGPNLGDHNAYRDGK
ncbi:CoA-transferase family III domain-containing protein [Lactifluus subvellereus]|nr:CoA-transferase family III domain-containing protein [Lactifluus subvellereus]